MDDSSSGTQVGFLEADSRRKLLYWGYYGWNDGNGHNWIYWGIPIIVVGVLVFIVAIAYYMVRKRRLARTQLPVASNPYPQPSPVTGYPDYTPQYNATYNNYGSYPQNPPPPTYGNSEGYDPNRNKQSSVEMGVPAQGYPQRY